MARNNVAGLLVDVLAQDGVHRIYSIPLRLQSGDGAEIVERPTSGSDTQIVTVEGDASGFAQHISASGHTFAADEPVAAGGTGTGPDPYQILLAALGACTSMTVALYARQRQWPLTRVRVQLAHSRESAQDCAACPTQAAQLDRIERVIELSGDLTDEQRRRLVEIAERCPIHRTLTSTIDIVTSLGQVRESGEKDR